MLTVDLRKLAPPYLQWFSALVHGNVQVQDASSDDAKASWHTLYGVAYDAERAILELDFRTFHDVIEDPGPLHASTEDGDVLRISMEDADGTPFSYRFRVRRPAPRRLTAHPQ